MGTDFGMWSDNRVGEILAERDAARQELNDKTVALSEAESWITRYGIERDQARARAERAEAALAEAQAERSRWQIRAARNEDELRKATGLAARHASDLVRAEAALRMVLAQFIEKGYPGQACLRTGWVGVGTIAAWRSVLEISSAAPEAAPSDDGGTSG